MSIEKTTIRADRTFDNFIVGESNQKAYQAALNCATQFGKQQGWLWIYSDTGLGGTHLLHAIGNKLLKKQYKLKTKHIHTERFAHNYKQALSKSDTAQFIENYSKIDCLFIDDIQYLLFFGYTYPKVINGLNKILSKLFLRKALVVFTADRPWQQLPESSFKKLAINCNQVTISQPEIALKKKISCHFFLGNGYELSDEIITFITEQEAGNIRELEGQINRIIQEISDTEKALELDLVNSFFIDYKNRFQ